MTGIADMIQWSLAHGPKSVLALQPSLHARAKALNPQARMCCRAGRVQQG